MDKGNSRIHGIKTRRMNTAPWSPESNITAGLYPQFHQLQGRHTKPREPQCQLTCASTWLRLTLKTKFKRVGALDKKRNLCYNVLLCVTRLNFFDLAGSQHKVVVRVGGWLGVVRGKPEQRQDLFRREYPEYPSPQGISHGEVWGCTG